MAGSPNPGGTQARAAGASSPSTPALEGSHAAAHGAHGAPGAAATVPGAVPAPAAAAPAAAAAGEGAAAGGGASSAAGEGGEEEKKALETAWNLYLQVGWGWRRTVDLPCCVFLIQLGHIHARTELLLVSLLFTSTAFFFFSWGVPNSVFRTEMCTHVARRGIRLYFLARAEIMVGWKARVAQTVQEPTKQGEIGVCCRGGGRGGATGMTGP